jgi:enoyl-CoA hydratase
MTITVAVAWSGDVCTVTLNRPATGNSLSPELVSALDSILDDCAVRRPQLVVFRGEGKHFCTGFDLGRLEEESDDSLLARFCRIELLLQRIHRAPFGTLAIAHGRTVGAGADLFAACTHRLAATGTQFAFPGAAGFGIVLGTRRLVHRVGAARATRWIRTGASIGLDEALATGLATGVLADASGEEAIRDCLAAALAPAAADDRLASVLGARDPVHDHLDLAALVRSAAVSGLKGRIAAYLEKGRPAQT